MSCTILVTGASGFLGSHLIKFLSKKYNVIGLKRHSSNLWRFNNKDNVVFANNLYEINNIDCIIHTATNYGRNDENIQEIVNANLIFGIELLEFAKTKSVPVFINIDTLQNPLSSPYCTSKNQLLEYFRYFNDIKIVNIAIEHMYGPFDDNKKFVCYVIEQMMMNNDIKLSKGEQLRDFIYISDVVHAFDVVIQNIHDIPNHSRFELGSGKQTKLKDFVCNILDTFNTLSQTKTRLLFGQLPYKKNENMNIKANIKALQDIGFYPQISNDEGIKQTILYYLHRGGVTTNSKTSYVDSITYSKVA